MTKTLTRLGNSLALVIDKPILDLLNIDDKTPLSIVTDGQSLVISPLINGDDEAKFEKALGELHKKYGKMLKKLAE
jgi:antitoxin component of MazEF toxin-antitoxin module